MPLAEYCIPTLGEMPDTHEIKTTQGVVVFSYGCF